MRALALVTAALSTLMLIAPPPAALASGSGVVVKSDRPSFWKGTVQRTKPVVRNVPECAKVGCDRVELDVRLPTRLRSKPGGVELAVRIVDATPDDSVGLVVYQGRRRVALSDAQIGTSRSVFLPKKDAHYTAYVFYNPFVPELASDTLRYEGLLENENTPRFPAVKTLLPDLMALPQRFATFDTPPPFFGDSAAPGSSCFQSEVETQNAKKCLRFGQAMANVGDGAVDVRYQMPAGQRPDHVEGAQRIYRSDGTFTDTPSVGMMHYHAIHQHYHFADWSVSELWAADATGKPVGTTPVATGQKNGFCMADTELQWWARKGNGVQSYPAPRCLDPEAGSPPGIDAFKNGISRGWADEYYWGLPDQMIEVSALADGTYALVTRIDPLDKIRELSNTNNCVRITVTMTGLATPTPHAAIGTTKPTAC